jgi:hypothetical protein
LLAAGLTSLGSELFEGDDAATSAAEVGNSHADTEGQEQEKRANLEGVIKILGPAIFKIEL